MLLRGVYVANVTPFKDGPSYALDAEAYLAHVSWLAETGVQGIVPFGSNGEGPSVTLEEKLRVLKALFEADLPLQVVPAVMEGNLPDTLRMLSFLEKSPATAILVLPPYYFKPAETEGLRRFYETVLSATRHPVVVYHIPKYAVPVPIELVLGLPVWGVKDSAGDEDYAQALLAGGKGVLSGTEDDLWRQLTVVGAAGVVSAIANFVPEQVVEVHDSAVAGRETEGKGLSARLREVRAMTKEHTSVAVLKKLAQARHGARMGTVRPPLTPVPTTYSPEPVLQLAEVARSGPA